MDESLDGKHSLSWKEKLKLCKLLRFTFPDKGKRLVFLSGKWDTGKEEKKKYPSYFSLASTWKFKLIKFSIIWSQLPFQKHPKPGSSQAPGTGDSHPLLSAPFYWKDSHLPLNLECPSLPCRIQLPPGQRKTSFLVNHTGLSSSSCFGPASAFPKHTTGPLSAPLLLICASTVWEMWWGLLKHRKYVHMFFYF